MPDRGRSLQREYETIVPGRYLDKEHWISVGPGSRVTVKLVEDLVALSYDLVLDRVPRRLRP